MNIINKKITEIIPYENNPRFNEKAVEYVANSIKEFGFKVPIVLDKNNVIVCGHTRYMASKKLQLKELPCVIADDLTEDQIRAFRIADNRVSEFSEWDMDLLSIEMDCLKENDFDMVDFGFEDFEFEIEGELNEGEYNEEDDIIAEPPKEPYSKQQDIWLLGKHRLMCGSSTSEEDVDRLVNGNKIEMTFTDPPYNIDYKGVSDNRKIKNDKMSDENFVEFLEKSIMKCETMYVCCSWQYCHLFKKAMENIGASPKAMIVWNKVNPAQHLDKYFKQHEIIWYFGKFGGQKTLRGDVWEVKRERNTVHPTMKPIPLIDIAMKDNPEPKNIFDGFGGSGSTLIACDINNKTCFTMELDEKYVDVIVKRYITHKGNEGKDVFLLRDGKKIAYSKIKKEFEGEE